MLPKVGIGKKGKTQTSILKKKKKKKGICETIKEINQRRLVDYVYEKYLKN
jgi:hypothetical protein